MKNIEKEIANLAYENYAKALPEIERLKKDLEYVRKGVTSLSEIQIDQDRLSKRVAREAMSSDKALERVNGSADFQDVGVLAKIQQKANAVGRVIIQNRYGESGYGTGFLIAPNLLMTNNHVLPDEETAEYSSVQFNYKLGVDGRPLVADTFNLKPDEFFITSNYRKDIADPYSGLDFTIVAVEEVNDKGVSIQKYPHARLDQNLGKIIDGEGCVVVQHPAGDYKKIVLKDIKMLVVQDDVLIYESDTKRGSSGSPVIGLGTGEVVALHHSAVPAKNRHGQWLKKDGSVWQDGDPDDDVDWKGNEGIRISRILKALRAMEISAQMVELRDSIFGEAPVGAVIDATPQYLYGASDNQSESSGAIDNNMITDKQTHYFEVQLSDVKELQKDWDNNSARIVPGLVSSEKLYPSSTKKEHRPYYYLQVQSNKSVWDVAAELEAIPQIETCTPDLPALSDITPGHYRRWNEASTFESINDGTANWKESEDGFIEKWRYAKWTGDAIGKDNPEEYRQWNRAAVSMLDLAKIQTDYPAINNNIDNIRMVQLDTGYDDHNKVLNGYNLDLDEDFLDGDDARDEFARGRLKHPGHGGRTASIVIGSFPNYTSDDPISNDGNQGVLTFNLQSRFENLIPYRVSQSVLLFGRGRNVFDAVKSAIAAKADVMFMCMGSYPRPMLYSIAKAAYDNGIIWVCAAGNQVETIVAPAMYPGTIAVAATNPNNDIWKGSSYGKSIDVAAPGEDVYVPFKDKRGNDIMVFGSGTSYATPHVASAAALWKAQNYEVLKKVKEPWIVVELFRHFLKESVTPHKTKYSKEKFGKGILNIADLLSDENKTILANAINDPKGVTNTIKISYAYEGFEEPAKWDLGIREAVHSFWEAIRRKLTPGFESFAGSSQLTERARISISALSDKPVNEVFESASGRIDSEQVEDILKVYFESFGKKKS